MTSEPYISHKGYTLFKTDPRLSGDKLDKLKKKLTVEPKSAPGYGPQEGKSFKIYKENKKKIYIPVHYGLKHYGEVKKTDFSKIYKTNLKFAGQLRDYQTKIVDTYVNHVKGKNISGGIISVGCGKGKTVMGLKIIQELKCKALILVHKNYLMNQWIERMEQFLPDARIGKIQGKTIDVRDKDIIIGVIQSLSDPRKDDEYNIDMFTDIGIIVADECHHLSAKRFSRSLRKCTYKYTLGLSATPTRADGLTHVFKHYLGDIIYKDTEIKKSKAELALSHIPDSIAHIIEYVNTDPKYCKEILNYQKRPNTVSMESQIADYIPRINFILEILKCIVKNKDRQVLILTSRRNHVFEMEERIIDQDIAEGSVGLYLGGMKQEDLDLSAKKRIIIATFDMAEEAFDCKTLNTLILATPKKKLKQAVGRIQRQKKEDRTVIPLIIDIYDKFSSFKKWGETRWEFYKSCKYEVHDFRYIKENDSFSNSKNLESYKIDYESLKKDIDIDNDSIGIYDLYKDVKKYMYIKSEKLKVSTNKKQEFRVVM